MSVLCFATLRSLHEVVGVKVTKERRETSSREVGVVVVISPRITGLDLFEIITYIR
jgi:hypothetical protein